MTEEEKKAIKNLKRAKNDILFSTLYSQEEEDKDIAIIPNLIERLNKEKEEAYYKGYAEREKEAIETCKACKYKEESKKKDKIINEMVEYIATLDIEEDICSKVKNENCDKMNFGECEDCIKEYFEKKVEAEEK